MPSPRAEAEELPWADRGAGGPGRRPLLWESQPPLEVFPLYLPGARKRPQPLPADFIGDAYLGDLILSVGQSLRGLDA